VGEGVRGEQNAISPSRRRKDERGGKTHLSRCVSKGRKTSKYLSFVDIGKPHYSGNGKRRARKDKKSRRGGGRKRECSRDVKTERLTRGGLRTQY